MAHNCKHYGNYSMFSPIETTGSELIDILRQNEDLKSLLSSMYYEGDTPYHLLSCEDKKNADDMWEVHRSECEECAGKQCPDNCGKEVLKSYLN